MSTHIRTSSLVPSLLLAAIVATLAAAVARFASPAGGLQLPRPQTSYGRASILSGIVSGIFRENGTGARAAVSSGVMAYPREALDSDNFHVRMAQPARRIISQSSIIDEYLYSVVPAQSVVAVSAGAYESNTSAVRGWVEQYHPAIAADPESILRLNPDLILVSSTARSDFTSLARSTGVPVYRMYTMFTSLDQVADTIRLLGYLTGADQAAQDAATRFRAELRQAMSLRPPDAPKPRILGLSGHIGYGRETLFNDIVAKLGGVNVAAENGLQGYDEVNTETILRWNPDWIVTGADAGQFDVVRAQLLSDPGIALTPAARQGHILVLPNRMLYSQSPFITSLAKALAEALYGHFPAAGGDNR